LTQIITALFDDYGDARDAVQSLEAAGIPHSDISIVANDAHGEHARTATKAGEDAGKGAGVGAAVGGLGGLLAGLGLMAIPGLGPVVAAGWLASTVLGAVGGAVVGAAAGGIVGALTKEGVPEDDAHVYAEGVRRGGTLVTARVADDQADTARRIINGERAVDLAGRRSAYQAQGWSRFDETAPSYTAAEIAAERARYL
jgi:hypothetical protein